MSRKSLFLAIAIVLFMLGTTCAALYVLVRHEPAFYVRGEVPSGEQRKELSKAFVSEFLSGIVNNFYSKHSWEGRFNEVGINSYFAEDLLTKHSAENPLPKGISEPRVALEADRIRLGFRYGSGWKSTVVSIEMRVWLVNKEPNVVALEFEKIHAGCLPISAQSLLDQAADFAHQKDIEAMWYRHNGRPVLVLRFEADKSNPRFQITRLELRPGKLCIGGRSLEATIPAALPAAPNS